jgi:hypothetical protein
MREHVGQHPRAGWTDRANFATGSNDEVIMLPPDLAEL